MMDAGEIFSSSFRRYTTEMEHFGSSFRGEEEDEEALKWAAIEKLPTFDRLKKGLLFGSNGEVVNEVDIANIGYGERQNLIERLVKIAQQDNQKFLQKLRNRLDRVGIVLPTVEVRFEHLKIDVDAYVGNRALPSFINFSTNMLEGLLNSLHIFPSKKKHISILRDVSGIIKPSRMTLLLGPPSSGKTTLLLALAGKLDPILKVSGNVTYNGHEMHEFVPQRTAAYVSQDDIHIGEMTVRETLAFSARCQGVGSRYDILKELSRREKEGNIKPDPDIDIYMKSAATEGQEASVVTDYVLRILGLEVCADTLVGDQMIRGISGGQRRRVTTGEMLVGPTNAFFMDEITTGLDSSTAFEIVNSIRHYVHIMKGTAFISLLQPTPETFDLFDDIVLLSDGHIVYQGPREQVLQFFLSMGFKCPERKGVADFLQEVTSKNDQHQYWIGKDESYRFITASEFSEAYQSFHVGVNLGDELAIPFDKSRSHPFALTTKIYGLNKKEILKACFSRELLLIRRNSFFYIFKLSQLLLMAIIAMTLFFRTKMPRESELDGSIYIAALFNVAIQIMFNGFSELVMTIQKLPVFFKQRDHLFYPSWAYALPSWILKIPITFIEVGLWVFLTYFVIGFDPSASRFFKQLLLLVLFNQTAAALFRFIGAAVRDMIIANTFGCFILLVYFALGGFVLEREQVSKWWIWGYWSSPLMYAQSAILVNEFRGNNWNQVPPNATEPLGVLVLKSRGFFPQEYWYWIGIAANCWFIAIFNVCFILSLTYLNPLEKPRSVLVREVENSALVAEGASNGASMKADADVVDQSRKRGMVLPFESHSITFSNIKYSIDMPQEMKDQGTLEDKLVLLNGVSGAFRPGVLTALMGISGAGKTTLMDVLAGRKTGGYIEGSITISGYPKVQQTFARISGYCEQNDIHSPHVTIYESLVYSAWLRLPVNSKTRKMFIEEVMELVELSPLRNALVGLPDIDGLSTEQRKRLTIAVELVANPSIIFMDEPTSGLDARAAAIVMRTVRNTVDTGRTVVCTIHQPSIDIFEDFDELFLMKRGGQEIYVGPLGRDSSQLIKYLEGVAGVPKIKYGYNPATWMLEVTASAQELALGVDFAEVYHNSELYRQNQLMIQEFSMPNSETYDLFFPTRYSQPFFTQCMACLWKQRMSYWRNTSYAAVRFYFTTFIALAFGTMFWNLGSKRRTQQDLFNAIGSMYVAVLFLGFQYSASVQPVVAIERTVFYREKAAGMYSALPYAFGQVMIEIQYVFSQSVFYGVITYAMIGFEWTTAKFFWYLFFICISLLYFTFFGIMLVAASPNPAISAIIGSTFYTLWGVFSGFTIPLSRIPIWWKWYYWTCPVAWSLNGLITSQYGDLKQQLENGELIEDFLKRYFGFRHDFLGVVAIVLFVLMVLFAFIYAFCIKSFNFQRR